MKFRVSPEKNAALDRRLAGLGVEESDLVEKSGLSKVRITRILDKLEARGVLERRRRGMTNAVVLK